MNLSGTGKGAFFVVKGRMQPFRVALKQWHGKEKGCFTGIYYFIWTVFVLSFTVVVLTCFVMCGCVYVWVL
jgi:hypothetical protein